MVAGDAEFGQARILFIPMAVGKGWILVYINDVCGITVVMGDFYSASTVYIVWGKG